MGFFSQLGALMSGAIRIGVDMETLGGFPCLPAMVRAEQSSAAPHATRRKPASVSGRGSVSDLRVAACVGGLA
jgi:hypothetical protein